MLALPCTLVGAFHPSLVIPTDHCRALHGALLAAFHPSLASVPPHPVAGREKLWTFAPPCPTGDQMQATLHLVSLLYLGQREAVTIPLSCGPVWCG